MNPSSKNVPLTDTQILANNSTNVNLTVNQFCLVPNRITVTYNQCPATYSTAVTDTDNPSCVVINPSTVPYNQCPATYSTAGINTDNTFTVENNHSTVTYNQCPATYSTAGTNTDNTDTVEINHSTVTYNQCPATYSTAGTNTDNTDTVEINHSTVTYNQCPATYSTAGTNTDNQSIRLLREEQNEIGSNNSSIKKSLDKKREAEASQQNLTNTAKTMNNNLNLPVCQCSRHHCKTIKRDMRRLQKHCNQRIQKLESSVKEISDRMDRSTYTQITGTFSAVVLLFVLYACRGKSRKRVSVR